VREREHVCVEEREREHVCVLTSERECVKEKGMRCWREDFKEIEG